MLGLLNALVLSPAFLSLVDAQCTTGNGRQIYMLILSASAHIRPCTSTQDRLYSVKICCHTLFEVQLNCPWHRGARQHSCKNRDYKSGVVWSIAYSWAWLMLRFHWEFSFQLNLYSVRDSYYGIPSSSKIVKLGMEYFLSLIFYSRYVLIQQFMLLPRP